jgi:DNA-binding CsgD family transcriptional regulator
MFEMSKSKYKYILQNVIFNIPKKEREIFKLLVQGYNAVEIGDKIGMAERTIYRRKESIKKKIINFI